MIELVGNNAPVILDATVAALEVIAKFIASHLISFGAMALFVVLGWVAGRS